jgi:hypothetical protein
MDCESDLATPELLDLLLISPQYRHLCIRFAASAGLFLRFDVCTKETVDLSVESLDVSKSINFSIGEKAEQRRKVFFQHSVIAWHVVADCIKLRYQDGSSAGSVYPILTLDFCKPLRLLRVDTQSAQVGLFVLPAQPLPALFQPCYLYLCSQPISADCNVRYGAFRLLAWLDAVAVLGRLQVLDGFILYPIAS